MVTDVDADAPPPDAVTVCGPQPEPVNVLCAGIRVLIVDVPAASESAVPSVGLIANVTGTLPGKPVAEHEIASPNVRVDGAHVSAGAAPATVSTTSRVNPPEDTPTVTDPEMLEPSVYPNENEPAASVVAVPTTTPSTVNVTSQFGGSPDPVIVISSPGVTSPAGVTTIATEPA